MYFWMQSFIRGMIKTISKHRKLQHLQNKTNRLKMHSQVEKSKYRLKGPPTITLFK